MTKKSSSDSLFLETKPKEFRDLVSKSVTKIIDQFVATKPQMMDSPCPFCGVDETNNVLFELSQLKYRKCKKCNSLYASPRPTENALKDFYALQPAQSMDSDLLPHFKQKRIEKVMRPRWKTLKEKLNANGIVFPVNKIMEVGAGIGHFIEVMQEDNAAKNFVAVEPAEACIAPLKKLPLTAVVPEFLENIPPSMNDNDLIFMNSVIEHPHSLQHFFETTKNLLKVGGMFVLVDMHSNGLDLEVLRGKAQNVNPFFILQVASINGIKTIAERYDMQVIDIFSMGQMDVDIIYDYSQHVPVDHPLHGFSYLLENADLRQDLQSVFRKHFATGYNGYIIKRVR